MIPLCSPCVHPVCGLRLMMIARQTERHRDSISADKRDSFFLVVGFYFCLNAQAIKKINAGGRNYRFQYV